MPLDQNGVCTCCVYPSGDRVSNSTPLQAALITILIVTSLVGLWWLAMACLPLKDRLRACRGSAAALLRPKWSSPVVSPFDQKANELYAVGRLQRYEWFLDNIAFFMTPLMVFASFWAVIYTYLSDDINSLAVAAYTNNGIQGAAIAVVAMCLTTWKRLLSLRAADFVFCALYISFAFSSAFAPNNFLYTSAARPALMSQVMIAVAIADPKIIFFPELVSFMIQVAAVLSNPVLAANWDQHLIVRLVCSAYVVGCSNFCSKWFWQMALALAREMEAAGDEAQLESLLSLVCDATVALNADLSFRKESPKFVGMLLRNPRSSILGRKFTDYIAADDVDRFLDFARSRTQGHQEASLIHICLLDSMGAKVRAQVFHTCMTDPIEDVPRHLLGVVEGSKQHVDFVPELFSPSQVNANMLIPPRFEEIHSPQEPSESGRSNCSVASHSSESSTGSRSQKVPRLLRGKRYVTVEGRPPFTLLQVSLGVRSMWKMDLTPLIGHPFPDWVEDSAAFKNFLIGGLAEASRTNEDVSGQFGPMDICPAARGQSAADFTTKKVLLVAIIPGGQESSSSDPAEHVYVELRHVKQASRSGRNADLENHVPTEAIPRLSMPQP